MRESYSAELWRLKHEIDRLNAELQSRDKQVLDDMLKPENVQANLDRWISQFDTAKTRWEIQTVEKPTPPKSTWRIIAKVAAATFGVSMIAILTLFRYI